MISLIAAIGQNRELGQNNQLVFHIKEDMEYFKRVTLGHPILMGRKTFDSIGRPLLAAPISSLPHTQNYCPTLSSPSHT